eukprot:TRINITY_DN54279_c0_g1_i1.p1 TRINITY_DN54279_c0_g1~~TRINITY_DN54279_c0_g1_i1.p1  ORF type:complete len:579 (+),score=88.05 TRINITY_DN54279_c0_g1_i1:161-1738(+)
MVSELCSPEVDDPHMDEDIAAPIKESLASPVSGDAIEQTGPAEAAPGAERETVVAADERDRDKMNEASTHGDLDAQQEFTVDTSESQQGGAAVSKGDDPSVSQEPSRETAEEALLAVSTVDDSSSVPQSEPALLPTSDALEPHLDKPAVVSSPSQQKPCVSSKSDEADIDETLASCPADAEQKPLAVSMNSESDTAKDAPFVAVASQRDKTVPATASLFSDDDDGPVAAAPLWKETMPATAPLFSDDEDEQKPACSVEKMTGDSAKRAETLNAEESSARAPLPVQQDEASLLALGARCNRCGVRLPLDPVAVNCHSDVCFSGARTPRGVVTPRGTFRVGRHGSRARSTSRSRATRRSGRDATTGAAEGPVSFAMDEDDLDNDDYDDDSEDEQQNGANADGERTEATTAAGGSFIDRANNGLREWFTASTGQVLSFLSTGDPEPSLPSSGARTPRDGRIDSWERWERGLDTMGVARCSRCGLRLPLEPDAVDRHSEECSASLPTLESFLQGTFHFQGDNAPAVERD